ncbi:penicillin-binding protein transpeptidase [Desulfarculus baarsii DSM 2075]|uniref:Penicillin-binding protein transpeptidase n=1 Tax=Desulfarculus baarsii (strain ATCC 33931 / DSM 2075 / LMG 7858 / VKM B-1802 / 2st14) TaxID=644282 RepID=E1QM56_DESB2|nr:penicillin-binding transpeptidase domain-containing protein [Desulfarculus baarsii]ADK86641.1 penicillin-binding protein transpeptidase [Desulfarculus baarsii DSM 2075]
MKATLAKALTAVCLAAALLVAPTTLQPAGAESVEAVAARPAPTLGKSDLAPLLKNKAAAMISVGHVYVNHPRHGLIRVQSTIDRRMQAQAEKMLAKQKSRRTAVAMVDAHTGRVLVLAGSEAGRLDPSQAIDAEPPAASLFKLVTAAATLEETPLAPNSKVSYSGHAHTLYRNQVAQKLRKWAHQITLSYSFAQSNNPVFGRLGVFRLGHGLLTRYAQALGFEQQLDFELPVEPSHLFNLNPKDSFAVAELASGYNRETTTSALHAALMVSTFVNGGRMPQPYVVQRVTDARGDLLYVGQPDIGPPVLSPKTCNDMEDLLHATVTCGTARREFGNSRRDKVLRRLDLGGKTGTIRGPDRTELYQWFAGYGRDQLTGRTYAIATLAVHGKVRYTNPRQVAAQMLRAAFSLPQLAQVR